MRAGGPRKVAPKKLRSIRGESKPESYARHPYSPHLLSRATRL